MGMDHFYGHRSDACELAEFAGERGMPMSQERAYRAWARHSDSMCAGWMIHALEGPDADITYEILASEERRMKAEDESLIQDKAADVDYLAERAEFGDLGLSREDVARIWADHSATRGETWSDMEQHEVDRVLEGHRADSSPGYGR